MSPGCRCNSSGSAQECRPGKQGRSRGASAKRWESGSHAPPPLLLCCPCCRPLLLNDQALLLRPSRNLGIQLGLWGGRECGAGRAEPRRLERLACMRTQATEMIRGTSRQAPSSSFEARPGSSACPAHMLRLILLPLRLTLLAHPLRLARRGLQAGGESSRAQCALECSAVQAPTSGWEAAGQTAPAGGQAVGTRSWHHPLPLPLPPRASWYRRCSSLMRAASARALAAASSTLQQGGGSKGRSRLSPRLQAAKPAAQPQRHGTRSRWTAALPARRTRRPTCARPRPPPAPPRWPASARVPPAGPC